MAEIRVHLIPTNDCRDLREIVQQLNSVQKVYRFFEISPVEKFLRLAQNAELCLQRELSHRETAILKGYIGHRDWMCQIRQYLTENCKRITGSDYNPMCDLAICVGAGVYVLDYKPDFNFDETKDAWACLFDFYIRKNTREEYAVSTSVREMDPSLAVLSLTRFDSVFGNSWSDLSNQNRAKLGRFIVANIAFFLGARSFVDTLAKDHIVKGCIMEENLAGGDRKPGYYSEGLCPECLSLTTRGPAESCNPQRSEGFTSEEIAAAISNICVAPKRWDSFIEFLDLVDQRVFAFLFAAIIVSLLTNLLAGWTVSDGFWKYISAHQPGFLSLAGAGVLLIFCLILRRPLQRLLPIMPPVRSAIIRDNGVMHVIKGLCGRR
jgi:hypothetical protein